MPDFGVGKEVRSESPMVSVDNVLRPGGYRFQLVVVDDSGNASAPAFLSVTVLAPPPPPPPGPRFDPRIFTTVPTKPIGPLNPRTIFER